MIQPIRPDMVSTIATAIASGAALTTTSVAALVVTGGGAHMTTAAALGTTATAHVGLKVAACALAATLTAGGTLAATGKLPATAQMFAADTAAHIGIHLPKPAIDGAVDLNGTLGVSQTISVGAAGRVGVMLDTDGLVLTTIDAATGFTANVVAESADAIIVDFRSGDRVSSLLVSNLDGTITSSVTGNASADADAEARLDGSAQVSSSTDQEGASFDGSVTVDLGAGLDG